MAFLHSGIGREKPEARHRRCRAFFCPALAFVIGACGPDDAPETVGTTAASHPVVIVGRLEDRDIDEASGLAASRLRPDVFWVVNDSGKARLYAIDAAGRALGHVKVADARNADWEDIASFELDGQAFLLIADIGDNDAKRRDVRIYVVAEPDPGDGEVEIAWEFEYEYARGPRDAESLAVDAPGRRILVLSKREIPAVLYEIPLQPAGKGRETAARLAEIMTLPRPTRQDLEFAPATKKWWWQPTAMDIARGGRAAVILTYRGVYLFRRAGNEDWVATLERRPELLYSGDLDTAESVAFGHDDGSVYITFEGRGAPLLRIDLEGDDEP